MHTQLTLKCVTEYAGLDYYNVVKRIGHEFKQDILKRISKSIEDRKHVVIFTGLYLFK